MPSVIGTRRRHSKRPSPSQKTIVPLAPSSVVSVTSNDSIPSSNATATPRSIFHSSLRPSKRPSEQEGGARRPALMNGLSKTIDRSEKANVDVFAFMERDEENESGIEDHIDEDTPEESSSGSDAAKGTKGPQESPRYSDLEVRAIQDGVQRAWGRASLHSDSGISVRSTSPDPESPVFPHKYPLIQNIPSIKEARCEDDESRSQALELNPDMSSGIPSYSNRHWHSTDTSHSDVPEAYRTSSGRLLIRNVQNSGPQIPEMYTKSTVDTIKVGVRSERPATAKKSGYDLLASSIDARDDTFLKPIYRKFEMLNNRMLLYLQDEISEMEDDLQELDKAIAVEDADMGRRPASRRSEAKLPSQLQWHRLDLLGRSFAKVEQYNRALTSYSKLTKSLNPASRKDIDSYRYWIAHHKPVVEQEAAFIQQEADLLSIGPQTPTEESPELETPVIVVAFALVSTIIVFKVVPRILARLVISAMVGMASLCTLSPSALKSFNNLWERKRGIAIYSAVMLVLSIVVS